MSDAPVTLFIPFGQGYGNPGVTVRADSFDELASIMKGLSDSSDPSDPEATTKLDVFLSDVDTVRAAVLLKFPQADAPQPRATNVTHPQAVNPSSGESCTHGAMKWKEGIGQSGKAYKGWFCQGPRGPEQCKPKFVN